MNNSNISLYYSRTPSPIKESLREIKRRILWTFGKQIQGRREQLPKWHNRYRGQKAVICCNGPSLNGVNLEQLNGTFTFGLNKIYLKYPDTSWRPSVIVAVNPLVIEQAREVYERDTIPLFLSSYGTRHIKRRNEVEFLYSLSSHIFSLNPSIGVFEGYTVTYVALQLAYYFGFAKVALVGCDHNFSTKGPASMVVKTHGQDNNHFAANYFGDGTAWQLPDLEGSEFAYRMAREAFHADGRQIVNCTVGGNLELFYRQPLDQFLNS